jgi:periplasmic mercuric ion binding protein
MKKYLILSLIALFSLQGLAQQKNAALKVSGDCGMCKNHIETAAKSVKGVLLAEWDSKTEFLSVRFDSSLTNKEAISLAVNNAGYDSELGKAPEKAYKKLDKCCRYRDDD